MGSTAFVCMNFGCGMGTFKAGATREINGNASAPSMVCPAGDGPASWGPETLPLAENSAKSVSRLSQEAVALPSAPTANRAMSP